jgi:hypothetical protein
MRNRALWLATLFLAIALSGLKVHAQADEASSSTGDTAQQKSNPTQTQTPDKASAATAVDPAEKEKPQKESDAPADKGKLHLRLGTVWVGGGYSHFSGPYYYPYGPYGFYPGDWVYGSAWYPMWGGYPYYPSGYFTYNNGRGELRLSADPKVAEVYIDGAYAGTADRLKSIWLDPGAYDLTVSAADRESFHQRVYVLSGKSLKITAKLGSDATTKEKL